MSLGEHDHSVFRVKSRTKYWSRRGKLGLKVISYRSQDPISFHKAGGFGLRLFDQLLQVRQFWASARIDDDHPLSPVLWSRDARCMSMIALQN